MSLITLTTDFGLAGPYVAQVKGVILGINPQASIVDITHLVEPQNIGQASFLIALAYPYFPDGSMHFVVVDPGVGSSRRAVILKTPRAIFVAPDNGVLCPVIEPFLEKPPAEGEASLLGSVLEAVSITSRSYWRFPLSSTFHGRDIFAPVAAHLSLGVPIDAFGERIGSLKVLPVPEVRKSSGLITGHVAYIDTFGNLITDIRADLIVGLPEPEIFIGPHRIKGLKNTYSEDEGLVAIRGSHGYLEIALVNGSAREFTGAAVGNEVVIKTSC